MASLVREVWLGGEPRLCGRRLAPWEEPRVRMLFPLDAASSLDEARVAGFLDGLAGRREVLAWEPRGQGGSGGRFGAEVLDDARRLVRQGASRWQEATGEDAAVLAPPWAAAVSTGTAAREGSA